MSSSPSVIHVYGDWLDYLSSRDLDYLTIGMVMDIWTEKANDSVKYDNLATQEDFDKF